MLAIIGGSGLYQLDGLVVTEQHTVTTPRLAIWPNHPGPVPRSAGVVSRATWRRTSIPAP